MPDDLELRLGAGNVDPALQVVLEKLKQLGVEINRIKSYTASLTDENQRFVFSLQEADKSLTRYRTIFKNVPGPGGTSGYTPERVELAGASGIKTLQDELKEISEDWDKYDKQQEDIVDKNIQARHKELAAEKEKLVAQQSGLAYYQREKQQAQDIANIKKNTAIETKAVKQEEQQITKQLTAMEKQAASEENVWRKVAIANSKDELRIEREKNQAWEEHNRGKIQGEKAVQAETRKQLQLEKQLEAENTRRVATANRFIKQQLTYQQQLTKETERFGITWEGAFRLFLVQSLHQAFTNFLRSLHEGAQTAIDLQIKLSEVMTIDTAQMPLDQWSKSIKQLSDTFGTSILDQTEAAYQTLSNQVAQGAAAFDFMAEANKFAITTLSTSADSINLLTSAINSFNLPISEANKISAEFFEGINLGRFRAKDLADTFGTVGTIASQMGASLEEVIAAYSLLTIRGVTTSNALTFLRNIFVQLAKPSKEMKKYLQELGVASGEQAIQVYGLGGFMTRLQEKTKGATNEIAELFTNIRGLQGALPFDEKGLKTYYDYLGKISDATGHYAEAFATVMETTGKRIRVEVNQIKNMFVEDLGGASLKILGSFPKVIENIDVAFMTLASTMTVILVPAAVAVGKQLLTLLKAVGSFSPAWRAVTLVVGASVIAWNLLKKRVEDLNKEFRDHIKNIEDIERKQKASFGRSLETIGKYAKERTQFIAQTYANELALHNKVINETATAYEALGKQLKVTYREINKDIEETVKNTTKQTRQLEQNIEKLTNSMRDSQLSLDNKFFDTAIKANEKYPRVQLAIVQARRELIKSQLEQSARNTKVEDFTKYQKEYIDLLAKELELRQQIGLSAEDLLKVQKNIQSEAGRIANLQKDMLATSERKLAIAIQEEEQQAELKDQIAELKASMSQFKLSDVLKLEPQEAIAAIDAYIKQVADLVELQDKFYTDKGKAAERQAPLGTEVEKLASIRKQLVAKIDLETTQKELQAKSEIFERTKKYVTDMNKLESDRAIAAAAVQQTFRDIFSYLITDLKRERSPYKAQLDLLNIKAETTPLTEQEKEKATDLTRTIRSIDEMIDKYSSISITANTSYSTITAYYERAIKLLEVFGKDNIWRNRVMDSLEKRLGEFGPKLLALTSAKEAITFSNEQLIKLNEQLVLVKGAIGPFPETTLQLTQYLATLGNDLKNFETSTLTTNDVFKTAVSNFDTAVKNFIENLKKPEQRGFGVGVKYAQGGLVDSVPALLTPGEFVMNKASTEKFYTQLVAMNKGIAPIQEASTTNLGGINITVNGGSTPEKTAQIIGQELNRAIRLGIIKLRN